MDIDATKAILKLSDDVSAGAWPYLGDIAWICVEKNLEVGNFYFTRGWTVAPIHGDARKFPQINFNRKDSRIAALHVAVRNGSCLHRIRSGVLEYSILEYGGERGPWITRE